ncbi:MAG: hypothetical protein LAP13_04815 [Acidobacteriia bacterium]|nr:hypothetical protein [Terriglobia bacterium]
MRPGKGTFLLEFCVAIPWILIAAILVASSARHILPNSDKPVVQAPHQAGQAAPKNLGLDKAGAPRALAFTPVVRLGDKNQHTRKKNAPPIGRKGDLDRDSEDIGGRAQDLAD